MKFALSIKSFFLSLICICYFQEGFGQVQLTQSFIKDTLRVDTYVKKALNYPIELNDSSNYFFEKALKIAIQLNSDQQIAKVFFNKGDYYYSNYKNFEAIKNFNKALPIFEKIKDTKNLSLLNYSLGESYLSAGSDDIAFKYYIRALHLYEKSNNQIKMAYCYNGIGTIYSNKNYNVAIKYIKKTFPIFMNHKDYNGLAMSYINIANAVASQGNDKQAIVFYFKSITALKKTDNQFNVAINYNNIGDSYNKLGEFNKGLYYFTKALTISNDLDSPYLNALLFHNIAESNFNLGFYKEALLYSNSSFELSKQCNDLDIQTSSLLLISKIHEKTGNDKLALQFTKEFIEIKERTLKETDKKKVQLFQSILELEKSQFQIKKLEVVNENNRLKLKAKRNLPYLLLFIMSLLSLFVILQMFQKRARKRVNRLLLAKTEQISKMKDKIQIQNDYLNDLNTTKNKLFKIIAHDLKNPLSSIEGFTDLMLTDDDNELEPEEKNLYLKVIKESATKASVILNDILYWAINQEKPIKNNKLAIYKVIKDELKLLEIQALQKEIKIKNKVDVQLSFVTDKNKLATIIRNLISNAIKFTPRNGKIELLSELNNDFVKITIKDNGVGIAQEDIASLFVVDYKKSKQGTNSEEGNGLGLVLCKDFIGKLGGQIDVVSELGKGSEFSFTLPYVTEELSETPMEVEEKV